MTHSGSAGVPDPRRFVHHLRTDRTAVTHQRASAATRATTARNAAANPREDSNVGRLNAVTQSRSGLRAEAPASSKYARPSSEVAATHIRCGTSPSSARFACSCCVRSAMCSANSSRPRPGGRFAQSAASRAIDSRRRPSAVMAGHRDTSAAPSTPSKPTTATQTSTKVYIGDLDELVSQGGAVPVGRDRSFPNTAIWQDADFRALPPLAQHLYFVLWTHPGLSYAGVADWRPARLAPMAGGWTRTDVEAAAACLEARLFIVVDQDTEECLVRSYVRFDGLMRQANLAVSFANAYAEVASNDIRRVIVRETQELQQLEPDIAAWKKDQVRGVLSQPAVDPRSRPLPTDPFTPRLTPSVTPAVAPALVTDATDADPQPDPGAGVPPTPSPSPTPLLPGVPDADASGAARQGTASRRRPERPIPDDWAPNEKHFRQAQQMCADLAHEVERFRNHEETHDRRARDWDAAFRNWLTKAKPAQRQPIETVSAWGRQYQRDPSERPAPGARAHRHRHGEAHGDRRHRRRRRRLRHPANAAVWRIITRLRERGEPTDPASVTAAVETTRGSDMDLNAVDALWLHQVYSEAPIAALADRYARLVVDFATRRRLGALFTRGNQMLTAIEDAAETVELLRVELDSVNRGAAEVRLVSETITETLDASSQPSSAIPTPWDDLNSLIRG